MLRLLPLSLVGLTAGCTVLGGGGESDSANGKADGFGEAGCELPEYGDGTCNPDLACAVPDIDCFRLFDDDAAAGQWFGGLEQLIAEQEGRERRAQLSDEDPRFLRMRALLDDGWQAYQRTNPVGRLAEARPALVVIEDSSVNAFVAPDLDTGNAAFAVMVHSGALDAQPDEAPMLGLVMHELEHAVRLHAMDGVADRLRRYYVARGEEPFGFQQLDDATARQHGEDWRAWASEAGPYTSERLDGLPLGGQLGLVFDMVIRPKASEPDCAEPVAAFDQLVADLEATYDPIAGTIAPDDDVADRVFWVLADLRDLCLPDLEQDLIGVIAELGGVSPDEIRAALAPEDLELVDGLHLVDGAAALAWDRRRRMRESEAAFAEAAGAPWSALRFYSHEEAADDATIPVLNEIELDPAGLADFLLEVLGPDTRAGCQELIDYGETPPYGADLTDDHHATCWRADHVIQLAASGKLFAPIDDPGQELRLAPPAAPRAPRPRLIPRRLSDLLVY